MTCAYCGTELPPGAMFCGECGRSVASKPAAQQPAVVVQEQQRPPAELVEPGVPDTAAAAEPVVVEPEVVAEPAVVVAAPVAARAVEQIPEAEPEPELEPVVEPDLPPDLDVVQPRVPERCAQCGAELEPSDIFCGECGFVRQAISAPGDTVAFDPFPWGLPRSVEPEPATAVFEDDIDETRIVDRSTRGERFVLQFSTGESVSVTGTGLLGRNPAAEPGEYFDTLVTISDPGKSVSKTHLEFGQDGGSFWVSDRFSGNGTIVREPEREPHRCDAGKRYRVARGSRVDIGEQFFIVS